MDSIYYIDRETGQRFQEKVYGGAFLRCLYGNGWLSRFVGVPLGHFLSKIPFFSRFYGNLQKKPRSKKKIIPFIKAYQIDSTEFLEPPSAFKSFDDFFIRKLKPSARPIDLNDNIAVMPADGRYRFFQSIDKSEGFFVKGEKFDLAALLEDEELAAEYAGGTMVIARLCPTDYHRYHFPCDCIPGETRLINGWLYSVNPLALKRNIRIFTQNKRTVCMLETTYFGKVVFLEIGAAGVGLIHQTYTPYQFCPKGSEKGYFSFGASALILLFQPNRLKLCADLIRESRENLEIRCLMGQPLGTL
jgi:phosphatidylserine decarboxylase